MVEERFTLVLPRDPPSESNACIVTCVGVSSSEVSEPTLTCTNDAGGENVIVSGPMGRPPFDSLPPTSAQAKKFGGLKPVTYVDVVQSSFVLGSLPPTAKSAE